MKITPLQWVLYFAGGLFCLAGPFLVVPEAWMRGLAAWMVGKEAIQATWPAGAASGYILRTAMVAYLWIGLTMVIAARDPARHRAHVDVAAAMLAVLAITTVVAGWTSGLPIWWYLGDCLASAVLAALLFFLRPARD